MRSFLTILVDPLIKGTSEAHLGDFVAVAGCA